MKRIILLITVLFTLFFVNAQTTRYMVEGGAGTKDGLSWANAADSLQAVINVSNPGDQIWVAAGTYQPAKNTSYRMAKGVAIYGHFHGNETSLSQRDLTTTDTSKLKGNGSKVIYNNYNAPADQYTLTSSAILDGFTITGGLDYNYTGGGGMKNYYASPTIRNCAFLNNTSHLGGGGLNCTYSKSSISNCVFSGNSDDIYGGGGLLLYKYDSTVTNCIISNNSAGGGGAISCMYASPKIINCLIVNNSGQTGAAISNTYTSQAIVSNCTIVANTIANGVSLFNNGDNAIQFNNTIIFDNILNGKAMFNWGDYNNNNLVQDSSKTNNGNLDATGLTDAQIFTDAAAGDYSLIANSPTVNTGSNSLYNGNINTDLDLGGKPRLTGVSIDIGAYEFINSPYKNGIMYVKKMSTGDGSSWSNAMGEVSNALTTAAQLNTTTSGSVKQIWVAAGTYQNSLNNSFTMLPDVGIYGHFHGEETALSQRNLGSTDTSKLLGNEAGVIKNDNNGLGNTAILDGFTITGGNNNNGGGISNTKVSPTISNCIIIGNYSWGGGGMFNSGASPTIINCKFLGNNGLYDGGGIYNYNGSSPNIYNCLFTGNLSNNGGGIRNLGTGTAPVVSNCTFGANFANNTSNGGGIYSDNSATVTINNSIIYGNSSGVSGTFTVNSSIIQNDGPTPNGSIPNDPLFVNPITTPGLTTDLGNYNLQSGSPAIQSGDNALYPGNITTDLDLGGNPRLYGSNIEMGAYTYNSPLPLKLLSFTGNSGNGFNHLFWNTATEINTKNFEVQRSSDGINFSAIGTVAAIGFGAGNYHFSDPLLQNGNYYYRLKMVDMDGSFTYSNIILLNNNAANSFVQIYPNPASGYLTITVSNELLNTMITVADVKGTILLHSKITALKQDIEISNWAAGVYFVRFENGKVERVVKQ